MRIKTLTVSEVSNYIKRILDNDFIVNNLSVKGEISNLKYHSSGHIYFSLKDNGGKLNCVMFKSRAYDLKFDLEEGMEVVIKGNCSIYPQNGSLQLYCDEIKKEGIGELYEKYEKLKEKLQGEGYFDEINKKPIPDMPYRIGVITSETGAVIRDIINVTRRRNSLVDIVLYPAAVQGLGAYKTLVEGLKYFNKSQSVDVIIIGRGGGSIEELWNFNEEALAIEIFKSKIPIISAVGHETDFTIADFVADVRAATPSQAAEIAVPEEKSILFNIQNSKEKLNLYIEDILQSERVRLENLTKLLKTNNPALLIANSFIQVDHLKEKLDNKIEAKLSIEKQRLKGLNDLLLAYNPLNVLNKGYSIIQDEEKNVLSSISELSNIKDISITLKDGTIKGVFTHKE